MRIAITDGKGRLGRVLAQYYPVVEMPIRHDVYDVIIHNGAYTQVDQAEVDVGKAVHQNVYLTDMIRNYSSARIIYLSTDFVFDGKGGPYNELAVPSPLSVYGWTKWMGERCLLPSDVIIRTTVLYGGHKPDFVTWVLDKLNSGEEFSVSNRLITSPTNVHHLAEALQYIAENGINKHIINVVGDTLVSRYSFARMIAKVFGKDVNQIRFTTQTDFGLAERPQRAGLKIDLAKSLGIPIYSVWEGLEKLNEN